MAQNNANFTAKECRVVMKCLSLTLVTGSQKVEAVHFIALDDRKNIHKR
jgi:hypothetical protein